MADWHEREKQKYDLAYEIGGYFPLEGRRAWDRFGAHPEFRKHQTVLDVGCADGYGVLLCRTLGIEGWGVDISDQSQKWREYGIADFCKVTPADQLPFEDNYFDFVACLDMMEHVPEEGVMPTFRELYRVGKKEFLFVVCVCEATNKFWDGSEPHVTIRPHEWWDDRVIESGFKIYKSSPSEDLSHVFIIANK